MKRLMTDLAREGMRTLSKVLLGAAALSFLFGGGILQAVTGVDWLLAEMEGVGLAVVLAGLGAWLRSCTGDG